MESQPEPARCPAQAVPLPDSPWGRLRSAPGLLALALVLGLLRFARLEAFGLWLDEALTWADYNHSLGGQIANPLGYLLIGWTVELLGGEPTEFALRLAPALAGWACIPLTYWAFSAALGRERAAIAALLVAVVPWHVFWSTSARFYTFAQATSLLGAGLWARGLLAGRILPALAGLALSGGAIAFHPTSAFLLPALLIAPLAPRAAGVRLAPAARRVAIRLLVLGGVLGLAAVPWGWNWIRFHASQKPLAEPAHLALTAGFHFTPLLLAAALVGALLALRRREAFPLLAAGVCLLGFGAALALSFLAQMTAQYVFVLLPWVALLAAVAVVPSASGARVWPVPLALLVLPLLAESLFLLTQGHGGRERWREAYEFVAERRQPGDLILGHASKLGELYLGQGTTDLRNPVRVSSLNYFFTRAPRHWNRRDRSVWIVYRPQWLAEMRPADQVAVERWLREECHLVRRFEVETQGRDLDVEVYRRP